MRRTWLSVAGAAIGAGVLLAACSPVKMGAAAIVGNDRITVASLDTQVSSLQADAKPYASQLTSTPAQRTAGVLTWLIRFKVQDKMTADAGISLSQTQVQQAWALLNAQERLQAQENGTTYDENQFLVMNDVPKSLLPQFQQYIAQEIAFDELHNGGKLPSTQAEQDKVSSAASKASCTAAKSLNIQVSPQFGRVDYSQQFSVVPGADTLSRPQGTPSPASTQGTAPAC